MKQLPPDAAPYQRTREFTESTVPDALRRRHTTKPGTWARICVLEGALRYRILEPHVEEHVLAPDSPGVVEPEVPHEVEPLGAVRFFVEFLRSDSQQICDRIRRRGGARVTVALFADQSWKAKADALSSVGLTPQADEGWFEVSREDALGIVVAALSHGLCYGTRKMSLDDARELVTPFFELMHFQTRYFTNSEVPYHRRDRNFWPFSRVGPGTVSTGVAFELAKELVGILWISDHD